MKPLHSMPTTKTTTSKTHRNVLLSGIGHHVVGMVLLLREVNSMLEITVRSRVITAKELRQLIQVGRFKDSIDTMSIQEV